jgi:uncharacterized membrane protein YfhO
LILEQEPDPKPGKSNAPGTARVVDSSTDHLTIEAELSDSAILLITDVYRQSWRATPLPGSAQKKYEILPANYILRAIPLAAGKHRLRLDYSPRAFSVGKWISLGSLVVYLALVGWRLAQARTGRASSSSGPPQRVD